MFYISLKKTKLMGYGVFAEKNFSMGDLIELCPAIPVPTKELRFVQKSIIDYWLFEWKNANDSALIFGYGMLYNHASTPNASYHYDYKKNTITFKCLKSIKKGQQIFIDYNQYGHHKPNHIPMLHPTTKKFLYHKST